MVIYPTTIKKIIIALCFIAAGVYAIAQPTNAKGWYESKDLEDVEIGWISVLKFKQPSKPFAQNGWKYSAEQTGFSEKIVSWWQQTYTPVGLLGEMKQSFLAPALSDWPKGGYRQLSDDSRFALPNTYGAFSNMHKCLIKTKTHKFWPMTGNYCDIPWNIMANNVELITNQVVGISSPEEYYFTMPAYKIGQTGGFEADFYKTYASYRDFTNSPNLKNYLHYLRPDVSRYVVIMTKDNQPLPFEQVTVGQFLNRIEAQFPVIAKMNSDSKVTTLLESAKRGFQIVKEKYKNRHEEFVYFQSPNKQDISLYDFQFIEEGKEINLFYTEAFTKAINNGYSSRSAHINYPLLRLKKGVKEACATSGPQWIVFSLDLPIDLGFRGNVDLMDHFVSRFNYAYVYDYFFGTRPTGPYTTVNFISDKEKTAQAAPAALSEQAKKYAADKSVLFFEDFSSTATGVSPANWNLQNSQLSGSKPVVIEIKGAQGKWLRLRRTAYPTKIPLPLTGDFTISFDLLVQKGDVPWGTPGMQMELQTGSGNRYNIDVSPGDMNRKDAAGWVIINQNMPAGYGTCKKENYYSIPDFTGSQPVNQVTMAVQKKGERITVLCNNKKVYECEKAVPADSSFKSLQFIVNEKNVYQLSNILVRNQ